MLKLHALQYPRMNGLEFLRTFMAHSPWMAQQAQQALSQLAATKALDRKGFTTCVDNIIKTNEMLETSYMQILSLIMYLVWTTES